MNVKYKIGMHWLDPEAQIFSPSSSKKQNWERRGGTSPDSIIFKKFYSMQEVMIKMKKLRTDAIFEVTNIQTGLLFYMDNRCSPTKIISEDEFLFIIL